MSADDGRTRIECRFESETRWLTQVLMNAGNISHELANTEYEQFRKQQALQPSRAEGDVEVVIAESKQLEETVKKAKSRSRPAKAGSHDFIHRGYRRRGGARMGRITAADWGRFSENGRMRSLK
ncbi:MAG: hypothetical protein R3B48_13655 [Kofleriaceae bacterium]